MRNPLSFKRNLIVMYEIWFSALQMFWSLQAHRWKTNSWAFSSAAAFRSEWTPARRRNRRLKLTHRSAENTVLYIIINIVWAVLFGLKRICSKLIVMLKNVRQRPLCWFYFVGAFIVQEGEAFLWPPDGIFPTLPWQSPLIKGHSNWKYL